MPGPDTHSSGLLNDARRLHKQGDDIRHSVGGKESMYTTQHSAAIL